MQLAGKYSKTEAKAFNILVSAGKPISSAAVTEKLYGRSKNRPMYSQQTALGSLRSLQRKVKLNREAFTIKNSERKGPHPMQFWIEKR